MAFGRLITTVSNFLEDTQYMPIYVTAAVYKAAQETGQIVSQLTQLLDPIKNQPISLLNMLSTLVAAIAFLNVSLDYQLYKPLVSILLPA